MDILSEIVKHFEEKGIYIKDIEENDKSFKINIIIKFNGCEYIEDLEMLKDFVKEENKPFIISTIEYNIHNALDRYLREG